MTSIAAQLFEGLKALITRIPLLRHARVINKVFVLTGVTSDVMISAAKSAALLDPRIWLIETGLILANINAEIIRHVNAVSSGVSSIGVIPAEIVFLQHSLAIYGYIWLLLFLTLLIARPIKTYIPEKQFSKNSYRVSVISLYLIIAIMVVAPLQFSGNIAAQHFNGGNVTIDEQTIPYYGVYQLGVNADAWISPAQSLVRQPGNKTGSGQVIQ